MWFFRNARSRAVWRGAHALINDARRGMEDVDPVFLRYWIDSSLRARRLFRACRTLTQRR